MASSSPDVPAPPGAHAKVLRAYVIGHALALVAYWFVPNDSWPHAIWQAVVTSSSATFLVLGARRLRPEGIRGWYFIAAGICINSWGVLVELIARRIFGVAFSPNVADAFWSSLFPLVSIGLVILARRAVAREDLGAMLLYTVICVPVTFFTGIYAWQSHAWQTQAHYDPRVALAYKIVVIAYPFGDLIFFGLLLRLLLNVGWRNVSLLLMILWLALLLPSDLGWPYFIRSGTLPTRLPQYLMEGSWMAACAIMGAVTWLPDVRAITQAPEGRMPPLGTLGWALLMACILTAPLVVILQIVLDRIYSLTSF